jgi:hypothetical protein
LRRCELAAAAAMAGRRTAVLMRGRRWGHPFIASARRGGRLVAKGPRRINARYGVGPRHACARARGRRHGRTYPPRGKPPLRPRRLLGVRQDDACRCHTQTLRLGRSTAAHGRDVAATRGRARALRRVGVFSPRCSCMCPCLAVQCTKFSMQSP